MANQQRAAVREPQQRAYAGDRQRRPERTRAAETGQHSQTRPNSERQAANRRPQQEGYQQRNVRRNPGTGSGQRQRDNDYRRAGAGQRTDYGQRAGAGQRTDYSQRAGQGARTDYGQRQKPAGRSAQNRPAYETARRQTAAASDGRRMYDDRRGADTRRGSELRRGADARQENDLRRRAGGGYERTEGNRRYSPEQTRDRSSQERGWARNGQGRRPSDQQMKVRSAPGVRVKAAEGNFRQPAYAEGRGAGAAENAGKKKVRRFYDYSLLFTIIFLTVFGLVMIYSSSSYSAQIKYDGDAGYFMRRQAMIAVAGFFAMMVISKMDYHFFAKFALLGYGLSYVFLLMVMLTPLGVEVNGKKRWLALGPLQFQPTELVKIALILLLAVMITRMGRKVDNIKGLLVLVAVTVPVAGLVAMNNLSSGIIILGIAFVMAFVASKLKWPFALCIAGAGVIYAFAGPIATVLEKIGLVQPYQLNRIHVWLQPEAYPQDGGYQVLQGLYAIGSGGLVGKGLGESIQKLGFIPEAQNDMVFSVICEELGLFGAISVILIFLFMIYRFMVIASNAPDLFGALLVVGVMGHIAIQVILNIAVVTNTIPNTGITLPFISYGGTSVGFLMMEMGMVLSVSNQVKIRT